MPKRKNNIVPTKPQLALDSLRWLFSYLFIYFNFLNRNDVSNFLIISPPVIHLPVHTARVAKLVAGKMRREGICDHSCTFHVMPSHQ